MKPKTQREILDLFLDKTTDVKLLFDQPGTQLVLSHPDGRVVTFVMKGTISRPANTNGGSSKA